MHFCSLNQPLMMMTGVYRSPVTCTLEMRPVIVNILNTAITMNKPLILMHVLTAAILGSEFIPWPSPCLTTCTSSLKTRPSRITGDQDEEELYANNSVLSLYLRPEQVMTFTVDKATFATCVFVPDRPLRLQLIASTGVFDAQKDERL